MENFTGKPDNFVQDEMDVFQRFVSELVLLRYL